LALRIGPDRRNLGGRLTVADIILTDEEIKRFWLKTRWNPTIGCLEWTAGKLSVGYGMFWVRTTNIEAHRIAWALSHGAIPEGLCVLHKCDNRACVNCDHLFLGTKGDNARDMCRKGRHKSQTKTHCQAGHEYPPPTPGKGGRARSCAQCQTVWRRTAYLKNPEKRRADSLRYFYEHRERLNEMRRLRYLKGRTPACS
jgi:hypothetical protein